MLVKAVWSLAALDHSRFLGFCKESATMFFCHKPFINNGKWKKVVIKNLCLLNPSGLSVFIKHL